MELTRNQVAERVAPRAMTRRRPNWELRGKREEAREVARFVSPRDKSAKLGDDVWGERKGKLVLQNELGSRRFFFFFTPSFQIKIVNSKGKFTWILRLKRKLEKTGLREKKRNELFFSSRRIVDFDRRVEGRELEKKTIKNVLMPFDH